MPTEHNTLSGSELHEAKGHAAADPNTVLTKNAGGDSEYQDLNTVVRKAATHYGALEIGTNTTAQPVVAATDGTLNTDSDYVKLYASPATVWIAGISDGTTPGADEVVVTNAGVYKIELYVSYTAPNNSDTAFKFAVNGLPPFSTRKLLRSAVSASDWGVSAGQGLVTLAAGDAVSIQVACTLTGNIVIDSATLILTELVEF